MTVLVGQKLPRLLVTGTSGQVGGQIAALAKMAGFECLSVPRALLDISVPENLPNVFADLKPDLVVNPAAYTAVDKAESEIDLAFRVNAHAPAIMARWCADHSVPFIQISTDYVFSGTATRPYDEEDLIAPIGVYGASKAEGEQAVRDAKGAHLILRTAWVYSAYGKNFLRTMLRLGAERDRLSVVMDQRGNPTAAVSIAQGLFAALPRFMEAPEILSGTYHYVDRGETTWWEFACSIFDLAEPYWGRKPTVQPIVTTEYPTPAKRPAYSVLNTQRFIERFGYQPPKWQESLRKEIQHFFEGQESAVKL